VCRHWTRWSAEISVKVQLRRKVRFMFRAMSDIGGSEPDVEGDIATCNPRPAGLGDDEVNDGYTPVVDGDIHHAVVT
jgi:hypothetical protein